MVFCTARFGSNKTDDLLSSFIPRHQILQRQLPTQQA